MALWNKYPTIRAPLCKFSKKLPKLNIYPRGENSLNLVTGFSSPPTNISERTCRFYERATPTHPPTGFNESLLRDGLLMISVSLKAINQPQASD
jgi:hypothetical protein